MINQKAKREMDIPRQKDSVRCILIIFSITMVLITFLGLAALWGAAIYYQRYGFIVFIPSVFFLGFALIMWIDTLVRKLVVTKEGLTVTRWNFLFPDFFYSFEGIKKIKVRKGFVSIKCKSSFNEPDYMFISNPKIFIKSIEKYASDKLDIK